MTKISKKIGKMWKDMTGVSPIIAVILMVAITVVLAATIYVWVSGFGGGSGEALSMSVNQVGNLNSGKASFVVTALSGNASWSSVKILVGSTPLTGVDDTLSDGNWNVTEKDVATGDDYIEAGDVINIYSSDANPGDTLRE